MDASLNKRISRHMGIRANTRLEVEQSAAFLLVGRGTVLTESPP